MMCSCRISLHIPLRGQRHVVLGNTLGGLENAEDRAGSRATGSFRAIEGDVFARFGSICKAIDSVSGSIFATIASREKSED